MPLTGIDNHLVTRLEPAAWRGLQHGTCRIAAGNDRQREFPFAAEANPDIKMVQAAGCDLYESILRTRLGFRSLTCPEDLRPSMFLDICGSQILLAPASGPPGGEYLTQSSARIQHNNTSARAIHWTSPGRTLQYSALLNNNI